MRLAFDDYTHKYLPQNNGLAAKELPQMPILLYTLELQNNKMITIDLPFQIHYDSIEPSPKMI